MGIKELNRERDHMRDTRMDIDMAMAIIERELDVMGIMPKPRETVHIQGRVIMGHMRKLESMLDEILIRELLTITCGVGRDGGIEHPEVGNEKDLHEDSREG